MFAFKSDSTVCVSMPRLFPPDTDGDEDLVVVLCCWKLFCMTFIIGCLLDVLDALPRSQDWSRFFLYWCSLSRPFELDVSDPDCVFLCS